jgi:hypothetical protein
MAINTTEQAKVAGIGVALYTLIPFIFVPTTVNWEILLIMIKC